MALKFLNDGYFAGKVGIGVQSPLELLHLESTEPLIRLDDTNSGLHYIFGQDGDGFKFTTNNSTYGKYTFDANVGIGTTSPGYKLSVDDNSVTNIPKTLLQFDAASIADNGGYNIDFRASSNDLANRYVARIRGIRESSGALSQLSFWTESGSALEQRMTIRASGNVGIGTTSPLKKLSINGGDVAVNNGNSFIVGAAITGNTQIGELGADSGQLQLLTESTRDIKFGSTTYGNIMFLEGSNGNVGIGTASPGAKLEVRKGGTTAAQADTDLIVQDSTAGSSTSQVQILGGATGFSNLYFSDTSAYNVGGFIYNHSSNYLATNVNGSEKMRITSTGNVGIGTTNPVNRLQVTGASVGIDSEYMIRDNRNNTIFQQSASTLATNRTLTIANATYGKIVIPNGNVGIGTTSPSQKLHVAGNARVTGAYYDSNNSPGAANQVLISTVTGTDWVDGSAIPGVPAGSGTLNTVAMWTPDGDTLGDSPITISGNNATFAGTVQATSYKIGGVTVLQGTSTVTVGSGGGTGKVQLNTTSGVGLILDGSNVGIGTTSPGAKLELKKQTTWGTLDNQVIYINNTGTGGNTGLLHDMGSITWRSGNVNTAAISGIRNTPGSGNNVDLRFTTATQSGGQQTSMTILSDGNVGIGTTSPRNDSGFVTLQVGDTTTAASQIVLDDNDTNGPWRIISNQSLIINDDATERMRIDSAGAIKFNAYDSTNNTGTPTYLLGTDGSGNVVKTNTVPGSAAGPYLPLAGGTMTAGAVVTFLASSGSTDDRLKFGASGQMQLFHDGSDGYIINSLGDVRMDVNTFRVRSSSGTETMIKATQNDNVELYFNDVRKIRTTSGGVFVEGEIKIDSALLDNQENTDVDTGTETVANVAIATYTAAFFDFVIKKTTNVRSGTVYACHDGTNVEFTETSTQDLGDTSDVTLSVDISGGNMRLRATTTSDDWSVKSLIRAI